jgi:hypothetical protein
MPLFYLDTSAIVKRYRSEAGTEVIIQLFDNAKPNDRFYTSFLSILELTSAIMRLEKGDQLSEAMAGEILARFRVDVQEIIQVWPLDNEIVAGAVQVVEEYRLRSGDAIHLATANALDLISAGDRMIVVSSDDELVDAARAAAFDSLNPIMVESVHHLRQLRGQN